MANATPVNPVDQFAARYTKGVGVAHKGATGMGMVALFGNLGNDQLNDRNFVRFLLDFLDDDDISLTTRWTLTDLATGAGTFTRVADAPQGLTVLAVVTAADNDGTQIQHVDANAGGEMYYPYAAQSYVVAWEARGSIDLALDADWFVGIAEVDTTFQANDGSLTGDNFMGFQHVSDATTVNLVQCGTANANEVIVAPDIALWTPEDADTTKRRVGIRMDNYGTDLYWYVEGRQVGKTSVGTAETGGTVVAFDGGMASTICLVNGSVAPVSATIDYIMSQATRV